MTDMQAKRVSASTRRSREATVEDAEAGKPYEAPPSKAQRNETVGSRIQQVRTQRGLTQQDLAKAGHVSRSAVAQWERDDSIPPLKTLKDIALAMETTAPFLAFGVKDEPKVVMPAPDVMGFAVVHEVAFGETADEQVEQGKWGLPVDFLRQELGVTSFDGLMIFKVEIDIGEYGFGDRVIVDRSQRRASPPGTFLYWDGIGPAIGKILVVPGGKKPMAKVTGATGTFEMEVSQLQIVGRVKGVWKKA